MLLAGVPASEEFEHMEIIAPHLNFRHLPKAFKFHAPGGEHEVIIERMHEGDLDELKHFEKEMEEFRDEMKELKKELKELKKSS